ncbi:MAG: hypothetical protein IKO05_03105 [Selenomonadaceae bacterium]|nr:hypothetical protein [Selenomonadaceae bacterium]
MISKDTALDALRLFHDTSLANSIWEGGLRIRRGNFEYVFNADEINYVGDGAEFMVASFKDEWTAAGTPQLSDGVLALDGVSWLERGAVELGGRDFQITGRAFEDPNDMAIRRKIFELYTSGDLNVSLYSSGAGKNLDLLVNCGGVYDNYFEPAILEREYTFALKWRQETSTLSLTVDGEEIYSLIVPAFAERKIFERVLVGGSVLHSNAAWKGTIAEFKIFDGWSD